MQYASERDDIHSFTTLFNHVTVYFFFCFTKEMRRAARSERYRKARKQVTGDENSYG